MITIMIFSSSLVTGQLFEEENENKTTFEKMDLSKVQTTIYEDKILLELDEMSSYLTVPGTPMIPKISKTYSYPLGPLSRDSL